MYSEQLLDHFDHPRNAGEVEDADAVIEITNPACGDVVRMSAKVVDERFAEVRFRAKGCVPAMACCSAITEIARNKTIDEAQRIRREDVIASVGGLPEASGHAAYLAVDALNAILKALAPKSRS